MAAVSYFMEGKTHDYHTGRCGPCESSELEGGAIAQITPHGRFVRRDDLVTFQVDRHRMVRWLSPARTSLAVASIRQLLSLEPRDQPQQTIDFYKTFWTRFRYCRFRQRLKGNGKCPIRHVMSRDAPGSCRLSLVGQCSWPNSASNPGRERRWPRRPAPEFRSLKKKKTTINLPPDGKIVSTR